MTGRISPRLCALLLFVLLALPACAPAAASNGVTVDESSAGSVVSVKTGQDFYVRLKSNITTGYSWAVQEGDEAVLPLQGEPEYITSDQDRKLAGAGGVEVFRFKPAKTGKVHLKLIYRRPWETDTKPAQTYEIDVDVQ